MSDLPEQFSRETVVKMVEHLLRKEQEKYETLIKNVSEEVICKTRTKEVRVWQFWWLLSRYGAHDKIPNAHEKEAIKTLYRDGKGFSMNELATIFQRSTETIHSIIHDPNVEVWNLDENGEEHEEQTTKSAAVSE